MSDPLESLLVDGPTTPLDELYRAITLAHGLNDAEREKLRAAARASLEAAERAAAVAAIERAYSVTADAWATARQRDEDPLDAWGEAITALHALLPGDAVGGE